MVNMSECNVNLGRYLECGGDTGNHAEEEIWDYNVHNHHFPTNLGVTSTPL